MFKSFYVTCKLEDLHELVSCVVLFVVDNFTVQTATNSSAVTMTHHDSVWRFRFTNRDQYYGVCCCTRVDVYEYEGEGSCARLPSCSPPPTTPPVPT